MFYLSVSAQTTPPTPPSSTTTQKQDKIPIISDLIELVGIGVSGWFIWRFLLFGPDRCVEVACDYCGWGCVSSCMLHVSLQPANSLSC